MGFFGTLMRLVVPSGGGLVILLSWLQRLVRNALHSGWVVSAFKNIMFYLPIE